MRVSGFRPQLDFMENQNAEVYLLEQVSQIGQNAIWFFCLFVSFSNWKGGEARAKDRAA